MPTPVQALNQYVDRITTLDTDEEGTPVDVHFFTVLVSKRLVPAHFRELLEATLSDNGGHGEFRDLSLERISGGPSYIEWGGFIGDQSEAMKMMAVGEVAGCWRVMTPKSLGLTGAAADELAGKGFVLTSGYQS